MFDLAPLYAHIREQKIPSGIFEKFCAYLLQSMGFRDVYNRRGDERGRDIDATLVNLRWHFECKFVADTVETASFAYKFLQLDTLAKAQRPDFFVLLSNGAITSVLKDIAQFKALDKYTTYRFEVWANHDSERTFDDIVLSCWQAVAEWFRPLIDDHGSRFWVDFARAGRDHVRANRSFVERLFDRPVLRSKANSNRRGQSRKSFARDVTLLAVRRDLACVATGPALLTIAVPDASAVGLLQCSSITAKRALARDFASWAMEVESRADNLGVAFVEAGRLAGVARTLMFEWGALATLEEIPFSSDGVVLPNELFPLIKEHSVRLRNYMKRGTLATPCSVWFRVEHLSEEWRLELGGGTALPRLRFRDITDSFSASTSLDPFEKSFSLGPMDNDFQSDVPLISDELRFPLPPDDYSLIGGPAAESLWRRVSGAKGLLQLVRQTEQELHAAWRDQKTDRLWRAFTELRKGFDYLLDADLFSRPYKIFDPTK